MVFQFDELYEILIELSKIRELKATTYSSLKGGIITGAITAVGGLLLGKYGLLLGAAIGGATCAALGDDFKPVWIILRDLPNEKKQILISRVVKAFKNIGVQDLAVVGTLLLRSDTLKNAAIKEISNYLQHEYNLRVV